MITSIWLILIEGFRGDSHTLIGGIRSGQLADFVFLGIVFILYEIRLSKNLLLGKGDAQNG
jgi:hypothetical protein